MVSPSGMWRSASNDRSLGATSFVVVGNPAGRRIALFQEALARLGLPPAQVVSYPDLLEGRAELPEVVRPGTIVRIESPDKDFEAERAILAAGADVADEDGFERISRQSAEQLSFERGRTVVTQSVTRAGARSVQSVPTIRWQPCFTTLIVE